MVNNATAVESLVKHTVQAAMTGDLSAQSIANIAYGAARSSDGKRMGALFMALARGVSPFSGAWVTFPPPPGRKGRLQPKLDIFSNHFLS